MDTLDEGRADGRRRQARTMNEEEMNEEALNTKYLVYCIVPTSGTQSPKGIVGVDGQPVILVSCNGLTAVASSINRGNAAPSIPSLLVYKEVIEAFHRGNTTGGMIPMRYGCMAEDKTHIRSLLRKNRLRYTELLKELSDCVEMGIRILIAECLVPSADSEKPIHHLENRNSKIENPGKTYLAARKTHYQHEERVSKQMEQIVERFRTAFAGLFVEYRAEIPSIARFQSTIDHNRLVSMYFLVPSASLDRFRRVFRQVDTGETEKLLMSGPWPPYNFVEPV